MPAPPGFAALQYPGLVRNVYRGNLLVADFDRRRFRDPTVGSDRLDRLDVFMSGLRTPLTNDPSASFPFAALYTHRTSFTLVPGTPTLIKVLSFEHNPVSLPEVFYGASAASDVDNDGDLDLLYLGATSDRPAYDPVTLLYANDGADNVRFNRVATSLPGLYYGSADWGDVDGDARPDLLLTGVGQDGRFLTGIYRNLGPQGFAALEAGLDAVGYGSARWGDYDNDGDLDVLLTGALESGRFVTKIYRQDGGAFTELDAGLPGQAFRNAAWFDYDSDGRLDVLLAGGTVSAFLLDARTVVYRNLGAGRFAEAFVEERGLFDGDLAVGDYDNDGDPDFVTSGRLGVLRGTTARIYRNDGGTFHRSHIVVDLVDAAFAFGDLDRDDDLDLFISGFDPSLVDPRGHPPTTQFYVNQLTPNTPPEPPTALEATMEGQRVVFAWAAATDDRTPTPGLTYNVRIGTTPGSGDVLSALAEADGQRWLSAPGNAGPTTELRLTLPGGTYYWSVQALDASYAGSAFAAEQVFEATGDPTDQTPPAAPEGVRAFAGDAGVVVSWAAGSEPDLARYRVYRGTTPNPTTLVATPDAATPYVVDREVAVGVTYYYRVSAEDASGNESAFSAVVAAQPRVVFAREPTFSRQSGSNMGAWGDYDSDGDLDLLLSAITFQIERMRIYRNDDGVLSETSLLSPRLTNVTGAWGDYDSDGDLDLVIAGTSQDIPETALFRNNNGQSFSFILNAELTGLTNAAMAWGDADNDGDLDLLLAGRASTDPVILLYRNDDGPFIEADVPLPGLTSASVAWGDYDNDGDLDLLLTGRTDTGSAATRLYRNDTAAGAASITFTALDAGLTGVTGGDAAWGDYDNDGDLDLVVVGRDETLSIASARLYRNIDGHFVDTRADLEGVTSGSVAWGDYDNDGDLDLVISGNGTDERFTRLYLNDRGRFLPSAITLPAFLAETVAWGDYDTDGDLDLLLAGLLSADNVAHIYRNDAPQANAAPSAPAGLRADVSGATVTLRWSAATDAETPAPGLTYNLRVGTAPGRTDVVPASSDLASGQRRLPAFGNAFHNTAWRLTGLLPGTYTWSVQAVDTGLRGSPFAEEAAFTITSGRGGTSTAREEAALPARPVLEVGYPNPFRDQARIRYALPGPAEVRLAVYDVLGRRVAVLADGRQASGTHTVAWDGTDDGGAQAASGVYLVRLALRDGPLLTRTLTRVR